MKPNDLLVSAWLTGSCSFLDSKNLLETLEPHFIASFVLEFLIFGLVCSFSWELHFIQPQGCDLLVVSIL